MLVDPEAGVEWNKMKCRIGGNMDFQNGTK